MYSCVSVHQTGLDIEAVGGTVHEVPQSIHSVLTPVKFRATTQPLDNIGTLYMWDFGEPEHLQSKDITTNESEFVHKYRYPGRFVCNENLNFMRNMPTKRGRRIKIIIREKTPILEINMHIHVQYAMRV